MYAQFMAVVLCALVAAPAIAGDTLKAMTFNLRLATGDDGENAWSKRRDLAVRIIRDQRPDVLGVQEAQPSQMDELVEALPEYVNVGVGRRADGSDEFSAVFYRRERFHLSDAGTFWLSETPSVPGSKTWGNNLPRIATWVRLLDRQSGRRFVAINTHWDHESQPARQHSAELMAARAQELGSDSEPVIVMGDFNAQPSNPAFQALLEKGNLRDTFLTANAEEKHVTTFNGFGKTPNGPKIDAILVSPQWQIENAEIIRVQEGNLFPSDHWPMTAVLSLPSSQ